MSSLTKMLSILDFFCEESPLLSIEEITTKIGCSRPQAYRYLRELCAFGLLTRFSGAYALGPRITELDFFMRHRDPLLRIAEPVVHELRNEIGCDVLLARIFGERIVAILHERSAETEIANYGRGRPMPLFRGAGSRMILACLPAAKQKRLLMKCVSAEKASGPAASWEQVRAELRKVRRAGHAVSIGELEPTNVGIAAPVFHDPDTPPAALILVMTRSRYATSNHKLIANITVRAANRITARAQERSDLKFMPFETAS